MQGYNMSELYNPLLYNTPYHRGDLSKLRFLITGGAGFIGSNLVEYLVKYHAGKVRVLDNLSNGYIENIQPFIDAGKIEFINGDIRDYETCKVAVEGIDYVFHQAALGSVPRSIKDPITTNEVNIGGFVNMLTASKETETVKRFIYAASSSTYGDSQELPKREDLIGNPLSPYAVTKLANELYAKVFSDVYGIETIGLRYFNVFGPKQSPDNPYAAVIALFCKAFILDGQPIIFGDGSTSRDFTFIENVVQANIKSVFCILKAKNNVCNIAYGQQISLLRVIELLQEISGKEIAPTFLDERLGDIKHSIADINKAKDIIDYNPTISFEVGMKIVYNWYKSVVIRNNS
jgi:UDP-N-acetylglucosamine 4-epimerase